MNIGLEPAAKTLDRGDGPAPPIDDAPPAPAPPFEAEELSPPATSPYRVRRGPRAGLAPFQVTAPDLDAVGAASLFAHDALDLVG